MSENIGKEIADALGLKRVRMINLRFEVGKPPIVVAEFYPEEDGILQMIPVLKKYELKIKESNDDFCRAG